MKKLQPIICLPTDKASRLYIAPDRKFYFSKRDEPSGVGTAVAHQFLYILSDEKPKEGDFTYCKNRIGSEILKMKGNIMCCKDCKKIIATSNPELHVDLGHVCLDQLPQLPLSLIEHYAKYQPKEVMVEYERICDQCFNDDSDDGCYCHHGNYKTIDKLKLTPSGEICWSPVEEIEVSRIEGITCNVCGKYVSITYKSAGVSVNLCKCEHPRAEVKEESWDEIWAKYDSFYRALGHNSDSSEYLEFEYWLKENYHVPKAK